MIQSGTWLDKWDLRRQEQITTESQRNCGDVNGSFYSLEDPNSDGGQDLNFPMKHKHRTTLLGGDFEARVYNGMDAGLCLSR